MPTESDYTRTLCADLKRENCHVQAMVGGMLQSGVPDRYVLTWEGRHVWVEMKKSDRVNAWPTLLKWSTLLGSGPNAAKQDEFIRRVVHRDSIGAAAIVAHEDPKRWAVYVPDERPMYRLLGTGRAAAIRWILTGRLS